MDAIVYTSNTGSTQEYAELFSKKTGLPAFSLREAEKKLPSGSEIIYMGWLAAGSVKGFGKAAKLYVVRALCGVGMGKTGSQIQDIRKQNSVADTTPVFMLQGNFDMKKLHGVYRFMMQCMKLTVGKSLVKKENKSADEKDMLDMLMNGGVRVKEENLSDLYGWYAKDGANL